MRNTIVRLTATFAACCIAVFAIGCGEGPFQSDKPQVSTCEEAKLKTAEQIGLCDREDVPEDSPCLSCKPGTEDCDLCTPKDGAVTCRKATEEEVYKACD